MCCELFRYRAARWHSKSIRNFTFTLNSILDNDQLKVLPPAAIQTHVAAIAWNSASI